MRNLKILRKRWIERGKRSLILGILSLVLAIAPAGAAPKILFFLGPLGYSLRVSSLETFAKTGAIDANLRDYLHYFTPQQQADFRQVLTQKVEISPVLLSRFFNSELGESILDRLGALIAIQGNINGKFALRSALVQAAFEPGGLTLLGVLQNLPTNMQVDIEQVMALANRLELIVKATNYFTETIADLSAIEAKNAGNTNFSQLPDLRQSGPYKVQQQRLVLTDKSRNRQFYVLIFRPENDLAGKIPTIVFSHGLGSRPEDYSQQAKYWASYGFFVAMPQHPGSDLQQVQNLLDGLSNQAFYTSEFIDRPLDIRYTIDELERRNATDYGEQLDLDNVGVGGHSFGGYGALAIAGARIDFNYLEKECHTPFSYLDAARLLQCRALSLPRKDYDFRDPRVKAVFAANPVNSSIFGPSGLAAIKIPVFLAAGTYDPAAPAVFEQLRSFPWLTVEDKYLALIEGQAHVDFAVLGVGVSQAIESALGLTLPSPYLLDSYSNSLSLAFFQIYINHNSSYRPFLQSAYAAYLSEKHSFKCFLISNASTQALLKAMDNFIRRYVS